MLQRNWGRCALNNTAAADKQLYEKKAAKLKDHMNRRLLDTQPGENLLQKNRGVFKAQKIQQKEGRDFEEDGEEDGGEDDDEYVDSRG